MRFTLPALLTLLACGLLAAPANAQVGGDRYGSNPSTSSGSSPDYEDLFKNLPSNSSTAGGYRSQTSTPRTTATTPPGSNELRSVTPPSATSRPTSRATASPPVRTSSPAAASVSPPPAPRPQASRPQARAGRSYQQPSATRSPAASTYSAPPRSPRVGSSLQSRFDQNAPRDQTVPSMSGERERNSRRILSKMLNYNGASELTGTPMSLASVVATATDRDEQAKRVEAYWMLSSAVTDYYLGLAEVNEMSALKAGQPTHSTTINQAISKQRVRVGTALKAARAAQHRLAKQMGQGGMMPLPSDVPFTGPYNTRLASAFPAGAPAEARLIDELLPLRLAEIYDAAEAISQSQAWFKQVAQRANATSDAEGVVRGLQLNALNRRAFVMLVRDYNLRISRYTQLTTPERVDTGRLVAMLIRTPNVVRQADDALMAGFSAGAGESAANSRFGTSAPSRR